MCLIERHRRRQRHRLAHPGPRRVQQFEERSVAQRCTVVARRSSRALTCRRQPSAAGSAVSAASLAARHRSRRPSSSEEPVKPRTDESTRASDDAVSGAPRGCRAPHERGRPAARDVGDPRPRAPSHGDVPPRSRRYAATVFAASPRSIDDMPQVRSRSRRAASTGRRPFGCRGHGASAGRASPSRERGTRGPRARQRRGRVLQRARDGVDEVVERNPAQLMSASSSLCGRRRRPRRQAARQVDADRFVAAAGRRVEVREHRPLGGRRGRPPRRARAGRPRAGPRRRRREARPGAPSRACAPGAGTA